MLDRLSKEQVEECKTATNLKTVVIARDGSLALEDFPFPTVRKNTLNALSTLKEAWSEKIGDLRRDRPRCAHRLNEKTLLPASIRKKEVQIPIQNATARGKSETKKVTQIHFACGLEYGITGRCNYEVNVTAVHERSPKDEDFLYQPWDEFPWMDTTSADYVSTVSKRNSDNYIQNARTSTSTSTFPASGSRFNNSFASTYRAPNPYTARGSDPIAPELPRYEDQVLFECAFCGKDVRAREAQVHIEGDCTKPKSTQLPQAAQRPPKGAPSYLKTPNPTSTAPPLPLAASSSSHGPPSVSSPTRPPNNSSSWSTQPPPRASSPDALDFTLLFSRAERVALMGINKASPRIKHAFLCDRCSRWTPILDWELHKDGVCQQLPKPQGPGEGASTQQGKGAGSKAGKLSGGRSGVGSAGVQGRRDPAFGTNGGSNSHQTPQRSERIVQRKRPAAALLDGSDNNAPHPSDGPIDSPKKRRRVSYRLPGVGSTLLDDTPGVGSQKGPVETIDLSSDDEAPVIKSVEEHANNLAPKEVIDLCGDEDDESVDQLVDEDEMGEEDGHQDDKSFFEAAILEELKS